MTIVRPLIIAVSLLAAVLLVSACARHGGNLITHTLI